MEPLIKVENVSVIYNEGKTNEFTALNDISLEVYPEEYLIFFGPSGSGKSTMLYTILGLQKPSRGTVRVQGQDSSKFTEKEHSHMVSNFFGIVFQNFNLIYSLNVEDNIMLPQVFLGASPKERRQKAETLMQRFGIATRAHNLPNNLSGGQQQRVAISRSLINDPQILLADEPVGNLDSESAKVVMHTLSEINRNDKKTIILVTHDPSYLPYADRVCYFKDSKLERIEKNDHPVILSQQPVGQEAVTPDVSPEEKMHQELEHLAGVHDHMSLQELKAWVMTQYLFREMTAGQTERMEKNMEQVLAGNLTIDQFRENLDMPYAQGGVGLYSATAKKYSRKMAEVLYVLKKFKKSIHGNHKQRREIIHLLRQFVLSEYHDDLSHAQMNHLEEAILARINQELTSEEFAILLHKSTDEGGMHIRQSTAYHLADKLDIILAALEV